MRIGLIIYGSLESLSGGYLYDRRLVEYLRLQRDTVEIFSLPWRNYAAHLTDNLGFRLPGNLDLLIQDELNHPSLLLANRGNHPYPIVSLVHHLRCLELRPKWKNALYRWVEKNYLQSVDAVICNSRTTERAVADLLGRRPPCHVAYPPTDRFGPLISQAGIRRRAQTGPLRILFLGNVIHRKGLHTLLEAIGIRPSAFRVEVIGSLDSEPAYARTLEQFVRRNDLSSSVVFHGPLDDPALAGRLKQAHLLVVPSSYEGFGIAYLEGMCFGLPAIGTTAGAAGEIIDDGQTGYLIEPNDAATLSTRLITLAEDRALLTHLSLNARRRYLRQPPWADTAREARDFLYAVATCGK
jgi:glycosyltransferase involved in cell wall biosynthesis